MPRQEFSSLRNGLVGAWCPSLGASGLTLIDRSGRGNHGTHAGSMTAASGGMTLDLTAGQSARFPNATLLYPSLTSVTFSTWVRIRSFPSGRGSLLETQSGSSSGNNFQFSPLIYSTGKLAFYIGVSGSTQNYYDSTGAFTLTAGNWYHICFTYLGGVALTGYVNGIQDATVSASLASLTASTNPVVIGNSLYETRSLNAQLDDLRFYSRVLTVTEIRLLASRRGIGLTPLPDRGGGLPRKLSVNVGGTWRAADAYVNTGGTWKLAQAAVNVAGTWR